MSNAAGGAHAIAPGGPSESSTVAGRGVYRGVLIGFGGIARNSHLPGARHSADVRKRLTIVGAIDPAPDAQRDADIPVVASVDQLADLGPIDFVDVCNPTAMHVATILWALERGLHVLCEKPAASTGADAQAIARAAAHAHRVVVPCHQYRFNPAWQQMQRWLRDGVIGHWHLGELSVYRPQADAGREQSGRPWRTVAAQGGGGILLDHGTHLLYCLFDAAGGPPVAVQGWTGRLRHRDYSVEDTAQLTFEFPDRIATMLLTWAATHRENRVRFIGDAGTIDWQGGVLRLERPSQPTETLDFTVQLDKRSYAGWFGQLFGVFADAMDRGTDAASLAEIDRIARVLEAAYEAGRTGARVAIT